jgi:hypothetical protein
LKKIIYSVLVFIFLGCGSTQLPKDLLKDTDNDAIMILSNVDKSFFENIKKLINEEESISRLDTYEYEDIYTCEYFGFTKIVEGSKTKKDFSFARYIKDEKECVFMDGGGVSKENKNFVLLIHGNK